MVDAGRRSRLRPHWVPVVCVLTVLIVGLASRALKGSNATQSKKLGLRGAYQRHASARGDWMSAVTGRLSATPALAQTDGLGDLALATVAGLGSLHVQQLLGMSVLVPPGESLYADGNRAQERLADLLYSRACRSAATPAETPLVVDVGCLLGDFTLTAAAAGCRVLCFEPQLKFARLVRANVALNGHDDGVLVLNAAVGEEHGRRLYFNKGDGSHAGVASFGPQVSAVLGRPGDKMKSSDPFSVPSYRLDAVILPNERILLLKIDVEGYDAAALASAKGLLQAGRVQHVIFEFTPFWTGLGQGRWLETLTWLTELKPRGLGPSRLYALHRTDDMCYGPLAASSLAYFHDVHLALHLQTDVYVTWEPANAFDPGCSGPWTEDVDA